MNKELGIKNFWFFISLVLIDQLSKYLIRSQGGFSVVCNKGIAFSINFPLFIYWAIVVAIVVLILTIILNSKFKILNEIKINKLKNLEFIVTALAGSRRSGKNLKFKIENSKLLLWGLTLVLSGGISNAIDRVQYKCVIDFIDLKYWPVFNLADVFISVGGLFLILAFFRKQRE